MEQDFTTKGYTILSQAISKKAINQLLNSFCHFIYTENGNQHASAFDEDLCQYLAKNRTFQAIIYNKIRTTPYLKKFLSDCGILSIIKKSFSTDFYLLEKIIFRIDLPLETSELAVWHQDFHYVRGNTEVMTAWIPLQDVSYINGCLSIMPGSHSKGYVAHTTNILIKKFIPENIYHYPMQYVEMKQGDCLLFHSLLLHSGNLNLSNKIRYSIQARFSPIGKPLPPDMGKAILLT